MCLLSQSKFEDTTHHPLQLGCGSMYRFALILRRFVLSPWSIWPGAKRGDGLASLGKFLAVGCDGWRRDFDDPQGQLLKCMTDRQQEILSSGTRTRVVYAMFACRRRKDWKEQQDTYLHEVVRMIQLGYDTSSQKHVICRSCLFHHEPCHESFSVPLRYVVECFNASVSDKPEHRDMIWIQLASLVVFNTVKQTRFTLQLILHTPTPDIGSCRGDHASLPSCDPLFGQN